MKRPSFLMLSLICLVLTILAAGLAWFVARSFEISCAAAAAQVSDLICASQHPIVGALRVIPVIPGLMAVSFFLLDRLTRETLGTGEDDHFGS